MYQNMQKNNISNDSINNPKYKQHDNYNYNLPSQSAVPSAQQNNNPHLGNYNNANKIQQQTNKPQ